MPEPVIRQLSSFLLFVFGGLGLGLAFELLRAVRADLRPRRLVSFFVDLAFWLAALAIVFPLLLVGTWGDPRLFFWVALLFGFSYYRVILSRFCRPLVRQMVGLILTGLRLPSRAGRGARFIRADLRMRTEVRRRRP